MMAQQQDDWSVELVMEEDNDDWEECRHPSD